MLSRIDGLVEATDIHPKMSSERFKKRGIKASTSLPLCRTYGVFRVPLHQSKGHTTRPELGISNVLSFAFRSAMLTSRPPRGIIQQHRLRQSPRHRKASLTQHDASDWHETRRMPSRRWIQVESNAPWGASDEETCRINSTCCTMTASRIAWLKHRMALKPRLNTDTSSQASSLSCGE